MEYAQLDEIWAAPPVSQPSKSKGRRQSGGPEQDDFSKKRNVDMRVPPAPYAHQAPEYGMYPGPEYTPYRMSAPIHPLYSHNRFHGNHLGTPPMHYCPNCMNRSRLRRRRGTPADTELQRMTLYLTVATLVLLLYDIGTRK